jgi:hypothetical protein
MTIQQAKQELSKLGISLVKTEYGEFRVNFKGGSEATAYYTDDLGDAIETAKSMREKQPQSGRLASSANRFSASQALDRISDHLEAIRKDIPREASNLRGLALRLDRVANTLETEQGVTERVSTIEGELDDLGVDFTVAPNSSGKQATYIYALKGQTGSSDEASILGRVAKKHGCGFENSKNTRAYKITIPHDA